MMDSQMSGELSDLQIATLEYCRDMIGQLAEMCRARDLKEQGDMLDALDLR